MAAKTNAQYKADQYKRKKELAEKLGIVDRVLPLPKSIWSMLQDLCTWHAFTDWRELVINMIRVAHAAGPAGTVLAEIPKSGFIPTEKQLRKVEKKPTCCACIALHPVRCVDHEDDE